MNPDSPKMRARVSKRGHVTIPKPLRERLAIQPGQVLEFSEESGKLIAAIVPDGAVGSEYDTADVGRKTDELLHELQQLRR
ncbi:MAG TPA: AbrB/MazE/SpoVT family DNA-binding domain-containing protein [Gaiellaceae bacterium]